MFDELKADIARLVALYEKEKQCADSLAGLLTERDAQVRKYREEVKKCKEQITDLNLQIDNLRLRSAFSSDSDRSQAEAGIDKLIKEIDECIKLLES